MAEEIKSGEITPESVYLNRRNFMRAGLIAGSTLLTGGIYRYFNPPPPKEVVTAQIENIAPTAETPIIKMSGEEPNTFKEITNYNNYYEFSTDKRGVSSKAEDFISRSYWRFFSVIEFIFTLRKRELRRLG